MGAFAHGAYYGEWFEASDEVVFGEEGVVEDGYCCMFFDGGPVAEFEGHVLVVVENCDAVGFRHFS